jgi:diaminopimelate epimerase
MTTIHFTKMHGLGNDFVVIDNIAQKLALSAAQIRFMADRHLGIGCDQLLLVEKPEASSNADFKYRIFNADGSEVAQCGNGARCFARFVRDKGLSSKQDILVDTQSRQLWLKFDEDGGITVNMGVPHHAPAEIPLQADTESPAYSVMVNGVEYSFGAVSMGNPHAVIAVDDLNQAPVNEVGKVLESHALFPERANIGFMQIINPQQIKLRVFERGAGETSACGSGACAAVVVGIEQKRLDRNVSVGLPGGNLTIQWQGRGQPVFMTGPAVSVFDGQIVL